MRRSRPRVKMVLIFIAFVTCAVILGVFMLHRYEERRAGAPATPVPQQSGTVSLTLFFAAPDASGLVREGRNVDACGDTSECIGSVVEELISGPLGDLEPTLPPTTVVRSVSVDNGVAVVDFEQGFREGLPSGSSAEMTAAYSLVDSIAVNFPAIRAVRILVDGKAVETLNGHLDLRQPLTPDYSLENAPNSANSPH